MVGHLGLTPQSVNQLGGYKVQGKDAATAQKLIDDAKVMNFAATEKLPDKEEEEAAEEAQPESGTAAEAAPATGAPAEGAPYVDEGIDELLRRAEEETAERTEENE